MRITLTIITLILSIGIQAQETTKQEKIAELLNVIDMDSMMESMYSQMEIMMQNMSTEMGVQSSEQAIFDEYYSKMTLVMRDSMSWKRMEPLAIEIYERNFSEKEITDMLDFYKSDTGKSILEKMPVVMQESMEIGQALMKETIPKIQIIAKELAQDLEEHRELTK